MKRYGHLWDSVCDVANVRRSILDVLATAKAKKRLKIRQRGKRYIPSTVDRQIQDWEQNTEFYAIKYSKLLRTQQYSFGKMTTATIYEPKRRIIEYPVNLADRVLARALLNATQDCILRKFNEHTYASVPGTGLHRMFKRLASAVRAHPDWYFLQMDVRHFFESIDHSLLMNDLYHVFKDKKVLDMFRKIIDCSKGLPIGVQTSAHLANLYLSGLDHLIKEEYAAPYYFRYMDDILFVLPTKEIAKEMKQIVIDYLSKKKLTIKNNWRIAPVSSGIHTCGYVFFPDHVRLRKRIAVRLKRKARNYVNADNKTFKQQLASHYGWAKIADCRHLLQKNFKDKFKLFDMEYRRLSEIKAENNWFGLPKEKRLSVTALFGKDIIIFEMLDIRIKGEEKIAVRFAFPDNETDLRYFITKSAVLRDRISQLEDELPFIAKIIQEKNYYAIE